VHKLETSKIIQAAAERGDPFAQFELALALEYGDAAAGQDIEQASKWYEKASAQGQRASNGGQMRFLAGCFAGLVWSNWIEYAYHRWALHWPSLYQPAAMRHTLHHAAPSDPQHITMKFGFWAAIFGMALASTSSSSLFSTNCSTCGY
jgi:TPR repeat protein